MKRRYIKALSSIGLLAVLAISVFLWIRSEGSAGNVRLYRKKYRVVMIAPVAAHPIWLEAKNGAEKSGETFNANITWKAVEGSPPDGSADVMVRYVEEAIEEQFDAIVVYPTQPGKFDNALKKAREAGIPVVTFVGDIDPELRIAYVGTDTASFGQTAAELLARKTDGKAEIAIIMSHLNSVNQVEEVAAFERTIGEKYPEMKVVTKQANRSDVIVTMEVVAKILEDYPQINCIWVAEGGGSSGAAGVLKRMGLTEQVLLLGTDGSDETIACIKDGSMWGSIVQDFYSMGYISVQYAVACLEGKEIPDMTDSGTFFVSAENVDSFQENVDAQKRLIEQNIPVD